MAVRQVRLIGDPVLRTTAAEVTEFTPELEKLVQDMIDTMRATGGVGLAAPQIGVEQRVFVYELGEELGHIINPVLHNSDQLQQPREEGCLSIPELHLPVVRHQETRVVGKNMYGEDVEITATDLLATIFQHETDHLNGVLFIDRVSKEDKRRAQSVLDSPEYQQKIAATRAQRSGSTGSAFTK